MKPARSVPVLMYHHISPCPGLVTLTPGHFAEQMAALSAAGYRTLDANQFGAYLAGNPVPDKSVVLSFDDGYLDNWVYAHPVLEKFAFTALMFVVTGWVREGPRRPHANQGSNNLPATPEHNVCKRIIAEGRSDEVIVRWSEIEAMVSAGTFEFHSHTHTHNRWDKTCVAPAEKRHALASDLASARSLLETRLGSTSDHLCWPQGYFDDDYLAVARNAGYRHLYTTVPGANLPGDDPAYIHRIVVKDKGARWLLSRLWLYRHPTLAHWYATRRKH
ncbi:Polysaccharide deacetylase [Georgfuchsia toluolica]|uniref:Polysaccharide deacetylase n=1 Tax=Georgfuchsia toluolica TaxID=424218 RepID=A0A916J654_9PROT|nr:polysaccharide deacetylase family protein [Georgfuchsia toluolica]CAG4884158.1 Polysaccharide deacetylase [Georgfuchsia toluolica]